MAARLRKNHQEDVRGKIQVSQLINVLTKQALDAKAKEISPIRMKAIEILLRKSLPDLSSVELSNANGAPFLVGLTGTDGRL
jgi:hypothetical protein